MRALFRSKVDGRFLWVALAMPCVALLALVTAPRGGGLLVWMAASIVALTAVMVGWIFMSTGYELQGEQLVVRCGPFVWRIPLADISDIRESSSVRSGPALSMDRLQVTCRGGRVLMISPADKAGFMATLRRRAPHLQV